MMPNTPFYEPPATKEKLGERLVVMVGQSLAKAVESEAVSKGEFNSDVLRRALEQYYAPHPFINADTGTNALRLPYVGAVPCGPLAQAVAEAGTFVCNQDVNDEVEGMEGDFWVRADGDSMREAGIHRNMMCLVHPYGRRFVGRGDICAIQVILSDETRVGTIKRFDGECNGIKQFVDGKGAPYELPEDGVAVEILGEVLSVVGKLQK